MTQKTAVITGANAGLGYATTLSLVRAGYRVIMACRNQAKAEEAKQALLQQEPGAELLILPLDISDPDSIQRFVEQFAQQPGALDVLITNAGILATPMSRNSAGHEMQMATNYLGNFALIGRLLPYFPTDRQARIVTVGSLSNRFGKLMLDDLNWETTPYDEMKAYANSKVALLTYTLELDRRLRASGKNILALSAHPGFANTDILHKNPENQPKNFLSRWFQELVRPLIPLPAQACRSILHAACAEDVNGGEYYGPGGLFEIGGKPARARINRVARVPENGARLWQLSAAMTGVHYLE